MDKPPVRVLLIDDDEDDYLLTRDLLLEIGGITLDWKSSYDDGLSALCTGQFDVCLLDYRLGSRTGLELLREARQRQCSLPVIVLTGQGERAIDVSAMEMGADDFVEKKALTTDRLERAIRYTLRKHRQAEQLEQLVRKKALDLDAVHRDLRTEIKVRQETDAALRESEQRFRHLADAMPQIVWISFPNGALEFINRQWGVITGQALNDSQTFEQMQQVIHVDDLQRLADVWARARERQTPFQVEMRIRHVADGQYRWYLTRGVPVSDDTGRLIKWYGTSTDIHEQKELEAEQRDAVRRKDAFLATLAHELRNPLPPIKNALEIMRLSQDNPQAVERGRAMIERQVNQLVRLIDDLLDLSRFTRGKLRLVLGEVDLDTVLHDAVEASRPLIESAGHRLNVHTPPEPVHFTGDGTRLTQAVLNLLNNAAKYTDPGGEIHLHAERNGDGLVIRVRDNGVGIARDKLKHIFQIFTQDERTAARSAGGLGIGLALVKGVVTLHGGTVDAHSDGLGQGSEFIIHLPLHPPEA